MSSQTIGRPAEILWPIRPINGWVSSVTNLWRFKRLRWVPAIPRLHRVVDAGRTKRLEQELTRRKKVEEDISRTYYDLSASRW